MCSVMAEKWQKLIFVLIFVFSLFNSVILSRKTLRPPTIITNEGDDIIIDANANFELFCQGDAPMLWKIPDPSEEHINRIVTEFSQVDETPTDSNYKYGRRLSVVTMTYPYVGYFYCVYDKSSNNIHDQRVSDKIYVYVNDSEVLSVYNGLNPIETYGTEHHDTIVPCRPTAPDITVQIDPMTNASYNPKLGFTLSEESVDYYTCSFNRGSVQTEIFLVNQIFTPTYYVPTPVIIDVSHGHTVVGEDLILSCEVETETEVFFQWFVSSKNGLIEIQDSPIRNKVNLTNVVEVKDRYYKTYNQNLTIHNVTLDERNAYFCNVSDRQKHSSSAEIDVDIYDENDHYIELSEENNITSITESAGKEMVLWRIDVTGHPKPNLTWKDKNGQEIISNNKYEVEFREAYKQIQAILKIKDITISDWGIYSLIATNKFETKVMKLFLNVTDKPTVQIKSKDFYLVGETDTVACEALGYPEPEIYWQYKPCIDEECEYELKQGVRNSTTSLLSINVTGPAMVRCDALNAYGEDSAEKQIYVSDIPNGFSIFEFDPNVEYVEKNQTVIAALGDSIFMSCGASIFNYSMVHWLHNGDHIENGSRYILTTSETKYTNRQKLEIKELAVSDNGVYTCRVNNEKYKKINLQVLPPKSPYFIPTKFNSKDISMDLGEKLSLSCESSGVPNPKVIWYKDGVEFKPSKSKIRFINNNQVLQFKNTMIYDEGIYKCVVANRIGSVQRQMSVKFNYVPKAGLPLWAIVLICFLIIVCIVAVIYILIKRNKEKKLQMQLKKLGLDTFEKGAVENLNPDLGVDDQAELLPYDKKWEFPIEKLKMGKQLGSGAFGVVMKAVAERIVDNEDSTIVAVKMVKRTADYTHLKALASELKIMVHLGRHLNVVNLLGACTKNVAKKELFVIVEYCKYGNLQNYLLRHRGNFINQVDPNTNRVDYSIGLEFLERTYSVSSEKSAAQSFPPNMKDYRENSNNYTGTSAVTEMTTISQDGVILSNNSIQPEWRSNYKGDYAGQVKPITTKDLVAWSFQVARGMEYLAARKVLHGDLAARNILLAENNVVKICDFGLAKSMYKNDNYKKSGNALLPVKWMAIESIRDRIFSTQSDVWSFGIVLWEIFSLARTPYPGMEANEHLYNKLVDGYRMDPPEFSPKEISNMMTRCWHVKPIFRPSFTDLCELLGDLLEDSVRKHYIDLNDPYLTMNTQNRQNGEDDYLAMLSPPTFENLSSPGFHYVNKNIVQQIPQENEGYLCMRPNTIFSPRTDAKEGVFDFNVSYKKDTDVARIPELKPMLANGATTPTSPDSYWNPSYRVLPGAEKKEGIIDSKDNYVNMPQYKNINSEVPQKKLAAQYVNTQPSWVHQSSVEV